MAALRVPRLSIPYCVRMLWRDHNRFLPALLAVGLSAILITVQCGLVMGLVVTTSTPIDHSSANLWVLPRDAPSLHQTSVFPLAWQDRLDLQPEIDRSEAYMVGVGLWRTPGTGKLELCLLLGVSLDRESLGAPRGFTPAVHAALAERGTVVVDAWELATLGLEGSPYEAGEINGHGVRLAGKLHGFQGFNFVYVFCSQETWRMLVPDAAKHVDLTTCLVARCRDPRSVDEVVARLRRDYPDMAVYSSPELSFKVRQYWLLRSRGGMVLIATMVLALLVGLAVTSETLYAAVLAQSKEFAVMEALGIPRRHVVWLVLVQSFWLGLGGIVMALPCTVVLANAAMWMRTRVVLSAPILALTFTLTLGMALLAGLSSLRPLRNIEPAKLLR